jgi:hypothetical protein
MAMVAAMSTEETSEAAEEMVTMSRSKVRGVAMMDVGSWCF